jgi:hypothetical protein
MLCYSFAFIRPFARKGRVHSFSLSYGILKVIVADCAKGCNVKLFSSERGRPPPFIKGAFHKTGGGRQFRLALNKPARKPVVRKVGRTLPKQTFCAFGIVYIDWVTIVWDAIRRIRRNHLESFLSGI